jgi:hypothetical protein
MNIDIKGLQDKYNKRLKQKEKEVKRRKKQQFCVAVVISQHRDGKIRDYNEFMNEKVKSTQLKKVRIGGKSSKTRKEENR